MARKYYVLLVREDGNWTIDFGDYDKFVVHDERQDKRDHDIKAKDLYILTVDGDTQAVIDAAVNEFRRTQSVMSERQRTARERMPLPFPVSST